MTMLPSDPLARAEFFCSLGFSVIPVPAGQKVPAITWKRFQTTPPTPLELRRLFRAPRLNIAIITGAVSGVVVVDEDSPEAAAWARQHLPNTPMRTRTSKGGHRFYRHPGTPIGNQARIRTDAGKLSLDVRGDGGYVVAPGSVHPSGALYVADGEWTPEAIQRLPVFDPEWLAQDVLVPSPAREYRGPLTDAFVRAERWLLRRDPAIQGQGGDQWTFMTACTLVRGFNLGDQDALTLLTRWNATCVPPWQDRELRQKVRNARRFGRGAFGYLIGTGGVEAIANGSRAS